MNTFNLHYSMIVLWPLAVCKTTQKATIFCDENNNNNAQIKNEIYCNTINDSNDISMGYNNILPLYCVRIKYV